MSRLTPTIGTKGLFALRSPFELVPGIEYHVAAVRSLEEVRVLDADPLTRIYLNNGLGKAEFEADRAAGANIVTLLAVNQTPVYVPDTYILSFPSKDSVPYSRLVLTSNLGPLPRDFDVALIEAKVRETISDILGFEPEVRFGELPYTGVITHDQHKTLQVAREAAIKNRNTSHAKAIEYEKLVYEQRERIQMLEQMLIDAGVIEVT